MNVMPYRFIYRPPGSPAARALSFDAVGASTRPGGGTMKVEAGTEIAGVGPVFARPRQGFLGHVTAGSRLVAFRGR